MRFHVTPRDVPPAIAARRMGLTQRDFEERVADLIGHGFPKPDPVTGHFDLVAIDHYCDRRNPALFGVEEPSGAITDEAVVMKRLAEMAGG